LYFGTLVTLKNFIVSFISKVHSAISLDSKKLYTLLVLHKSLEKWYLDFSFYYLYNWYTC